MYLQYFFYEHIFSASEEIATIIIIIDGGRDEGILVG